MYKLGFIGCGHMGMSILKGALLQRILYNTDICVYDPSENVISTCKELGVGVASDEVTLVRLSDILVLAITPQIIDDVLSKIKDEKINCVISIAAAITINHINTFLKDTPVIRLMPNTPLMVGYGATALCHNDLCTKEYIDFTKNLFSSIGIVEEIDEEKMNQIIAVSGSTPAYFYEFLNVLLKDAVDNGIDYNIARSFLIQTMMGSAKLLESEPEKPVDEFVDAVCSKGGTTIEAITSLRNDHLEEIVKKANIACVNRAKQLTK